MILWRTPQTPPSQSSFDSTYTVNNFKADTIAAIGFTDYANGDYLLTDSSPYKTAASDGTQVGADITTLNTKTAGVI